MAHERPLKSPPIREALVDIRIAADSKIDANALGSLKPALEADFPKVEVRTTFQAELKVEDGRIVSPTAHEVGFHGLFFTSADGTRVAQFRQDGFTLNQLKPYRGADDLIATALRLWGLYRELSQPVAVVRTALRYINSLDLPYHPKDDFKRFLTVPPEMPPSAPQLVSSFLTRMVAHEGADCVIVTQRLENVAESSPTAVTLDIDAFRPLAIPVDSDSLEGVMVGLRTLKNRTFFGLVTEEALDLFA